MDYRKKEKLIEDLKDMAFGLIASVPATVIIFAFLHFTGVFPLF